MYITVYMYYSCNYLIYIVLKYTTYILYECIADGFQSENYNFYCFHKQADRSAYMNVYFHSNQKMVS